MTVIIRPATKKDLPAIRKLSVELEKTRTKLWEKENKLFHKKTVLNKVIKKISTTDCVFVAEQNNNIVGFVWGELSSRKNSILSKTGYISGLFIKANIRRQGASKKLLKNLFQIFKEKGCDHIIVHTDSENLPAQALYKSVGMSQVTVELWKKI